MKKRDSASEESTPEPSAEQVPVEERSNNPYPKPVRRSREVPEEPQLPDFDSLTLPESSLSDMPLTKNALFEALGLTPPDTIDEIEQGTDATAAVAPATTVAPPAAVAPATAVTPSIASTSTTARQGSSPAPNKRAPIWSEDWDAWIYWDTTLRTWFRHDMAGGTWVPMDED